MPRIDEVAKERLVPIPGNPPSLINIPSGCAFNPRCTYKEFSAVACNEVVPQLIESYPKHDSRCHIPVPTRAQILAELVSTRSGDEPA